MTNPPEQAFVVPGYERLRPLSDRERSKLFLARAQDGRLLALKVELPQATGKTGTILARYRKLKELSVSAGFAPIFDVGVLDSGWIWHVMPLADNLPGLASIHSETGLVEYTPLTLAAWIVEKGPASAALVVQWGLQVCRALGALHRAGFVHRDVKPANLLFIEGRLCLADYGLVGPPGSECDFSGTEGFIPLEGTADPAADLFALGKTLYQAWSAKDRLEFPSLPLSVTEGPDWSRYGVRLNDLILRACHAQPSRRFGSAEQLSQVLDEVLTGRKKFSRRRCLVMTGALSAVVAGSWFIRHSRPAARAVWRRVHDPIQLEAWEGHFGTVDWASRRLYSVCCDLTGCWFHSVDLATFAVKTRALDALPKEPLNSLLHPISRKVWSVDGGLGDVYEIDPDTGLVRSLGGGPCERKNFGAALYWNPITDRLGSFGGYGFFKVTNTRHEFDQVSGKWVAIEGLPTDKLPCPRRTPRPFFYSTEPTRLFLEGGSGSPSGQQGKEAKGLRGFNGQFHNLDDIWELDLRNNRWVEILPNGVFPEATLYPGGRTIFYHPVLNGIVVIIPSMYENASQGKVTAWILRLGVDAKPLPVTQEGEASHRGSCWAYTLDPQTHELVFFGHDGVFRVQFS